jgi:hypothetical protein
LNEGVTIEIDGHGTPAGAVAGSGGVSTVQGQPVRPGGGGGNSANLGQCMRLIGWQMWAASGQPDLWRVVMRGGQRQLFI